MLAVLQFTTMISQTFALTLQSDASFLVKRGEFCGLNEVIVQHMRGILYDACSLRSHAVFDVLCLSSLCSHQGSLVSPGTLPFVTNQCVMPGMTQGHDTYSYYREITTHVRLSERNTQHQHSQETQQGTTSCFRCTTVCVDDTNSLNGMILTWIDNLCNLQQLLLVIQMKLPLVDKGFGSALESSHSTCWYHLCILYIETDHDGSVYC